MGLFSTIGTFLGGPFGAAIGGIADGVVGASEKRKQVKAQNALNMRKYADLRKAAELGGFHPLEVLRAGGDVTQQAAPRIMSTLAMSNSFDALENEISGEGAKQRRRQEVIDEIAERELENMKTATVRGTMTTPSIYSNRPARIDNGLVQTDMGPVPVEEIKKPTPVNPDGSRNLEVDDGGTNVTLAPRNRIVTDNGETIDATAGLDFDEFMMGIAFDAAGRVKREGLLGTFSTGGARTGRGWEETLFGTRGRPKRKTEISEAAPLPWFPEYERFGPKPAQWNQWSNKEKLQWMNKGRK